MAKIGSRVFLCNFDDKPGALCRDGCSHPWILYVPVAAGYRCDRCRTFQRDDLSKSLPVEFHAYHSAQVRCGAATTPSSSTAKAGKHDVE